MPVNWTAEGDPGVFSSVQQTVIDAFQEDIVVICPPTDHGHVGDSHYSPRAPGCILVASREDQGKLGLSSIRREAQFLFPGKKRSSINHTTLESGASVAPGLAAGVAGLLIFCCRLLGMESNTVEGRELIYTIAIPRAFETMTAGRKRQETYFIRWNTYASMASENPTFVDVRRHFERPILSMGKHRKNEVEADEVSTVSWNKECLKALEEAMEEAGLMYPYQ